MFTKNDDIEWELICVHFIRLCRQLKNYMEFSLLKIPLLVIENESHIFQINDQKILLYEIVVLFTDKSGNCCILNLNIYHSTIVIAYNWSKVLPKNCALNLRILKNHYVSIPIQNQSTLRRRTNDEDIKSCHLQIPSIEIHAYEMEMFWCDRSCFHHSYSFGVLFYISKPSN